MSRVQNWPKILHNQTNDSVVVFEWGLNDCVLWPMRIAGLLCGEDFTSMREQRYSTRDGAIRSLQAEFESPPVVGRLVEAAIDKVLKGRDVPLSYMGRGDIGLMRSEMDPQLATSPVICVDHRVAAIGFEGVVLLPKTGVLRAWKI